MPSRPWPRLRQLLAGGAALGGAFDAVSVRALLPHHERALGVLPGAAPPATAALVLLVLHVLGVVLMAVGLAAWLLATAWERTGDRRWRWGAAIVLLLAELPNAGAIARLGSAFAIGPAVIALGAPLVVWWASRGTDGTGAST
jgi:hypothetical protein